MSKRDVEILECTIRDGNYTVNFKFTERDTSLLTGQLAQLGFRWIEVGHGLGLGAMEAGKGNMPASDADLIKAAKQQCADAKIGMFFIPGIGKLEHLDMAKSLGLDFVRIGANAAELESTYPFVRHARKIGLLPCVNMMKTYTVTPDEFADKGKAAWQEGAEIIYCVDSSGGMLSDDVARYFDAVRRVCQCDLGFHGHNNLMLAIDNCVRAHRHGAKFLDTTLCGIGRSAGNAPTEILIAVLDRMNVKSGIDLFKLMDVIEEYMWPLVGQVRPHDMVGVVSGYANFHSGFLGKVAKVAEKYDVDLRRLIAKVSFHNPETVEDDYLAQAAKEMAGTRSRAASNQLFSFDVPEVSVNHLSSSFGSVNALVDGLIVTSSKRAGSKILLHLVPSNEELEGLVMPEFVYSDEQAVVGRVRYGSMEDLRQVIAQTKSNVFMYLVNQGEGWAKDVMSVLTPLADRRQLVPIRDEDIKQAFLVETLDRAGQVYGRRSCLIYGGSRLIEGVLAEAINFDQVFMVGGQQVKGQVKANSVHVSNLQECRDLSLQVDVILVAANPSDSDAAFLAGLLAANGRVISITPNPSATLQAALGRRCLFLSLNLAYAGMVSRYIATERYLI